MASLCVDHLLRDHREGERILNELESLLNERSTGGCWSVAQGENFLRLAGFFDGVVLGHIRKEEEVLFPALEAYLPRDIGPLAVLRGEHKELCALFLRLLTAGKQLAEGEGPPATCEEFQGAGRALLQVFRDHIYKEDRILFPMVARFLSAGRDAELLLEMMRLSGTETPTKQEVSR